MSATTLNQKQKENVVKSVHVRVLHQVEIGETVLAPGRIYKAEYRYIAEYDVHRVEVEHQNGQVVGFSSPGRVHDSIRFVTPPGVLETAEETRVRKHFEAFNAALDEVEASAW